MVFIGESDSGKSIILKLLSLFRWIYKQQQLYYSLEILTKGRVDFEANINQRLELELHNSSLIDYFQKGSFASYEIDGIIFAIKADTNTKFTIANKRDTKKISFEKNWSWGYFASKTQFLKPKTKC